MTVAVGAFTDFCFENFPLRRISAEVFANNPASARLKKPASLSKDASRTTSSKMGSFSIPCSTPGQSSSCEAATCVSLDHRRYGSLIKPMISFVLPAYNEEHELSDTLAAIREAASGATQPYEIIVVDDASTDATAEIASGAGA